MDDYKFRLLKKTYMLITGEKTKPFFKKIDLFLEKQLGNWYYLYLEKLKKKLKYGYSTKTGEEIRHIWSSERFEKMEKDPLVSVIVPSFNHASFLRERLESIYHQSYQNYEVIILDDASEDESLEIIREYEKKFAGSTRVLVNETNSSNVYSQWKKGLEIARGDLIWIAESDDYCENDFLEKLVPCFQYNSVKIAFSHSVFMQDGKQIGSTEEYLKDLEIFNWRKSFFMTAHEAVKNGFAIHNLIANVSSAIFRRPFSVPDEIDQMCSEMKLSFDWLFYLYLIRGGSLAYVADVNAYYRIHENSTSLKVQRTRNYYEEYFRISCYIAEHYRIEQEVFRRVLRYLKEHFSIFHTGRDNSIIEKIYQLERIEECGKKRKWNILMCGYCFQPGGGETFPIFLANQLFAEGYGVTYLDFHQEPENKKIRNLLYHDIPVVSISSLDNMYWIIEQLGGDIIHTHHAFTDEAVGCWMLNHSFQCRQIITLHGFYELMDDSNCSRVLKVTGNSAAYYCYVAEKNLLPFEKNGYYKKNDSEKQGKFIKIPNGLPTLEDPLLRRSDFGIGEKDFIVTLASRAIPEKGWLEAMEAVKEANRRSERRIWLFLLGDGEMKEILEQAAPEEVFFTGVVNHVRSYFRMADAGLLPTTFAGESYPLSVIECLQSGKPVIVTDIAEVKNEIQDENGDPAGVLLTMINGRIDVAELTDKILLLAGDSLYYETLCSRCASASKKFCMDRVTESYREVYQKAICQIEELEPENGSI